MADSKLEIKVGSIVFSGEGAGEWLSKQLDKVLTKLPELTAIQGKGTNPEGEQTLNTDITEKKVKSHHAALATFLKEKKAATGNQQKKFLATAEWLHDTGAKRLSTGDITKALSEHNQGKLNNAGQCLINLTKYGWVVREGKQFYVTEEGRTELGK